MSEYNLSEIKKDDRRGNRLMDELLQRADLVCLHCPLYCPAGLSSVMMHYSEET